MSIAATPPYLHKHDGVVLVCGSALCLHDDVVRARAIVGDAPCIAVNGAAREMKALILFSAHPARFVERGHEWLRHQRRLFGDGFTVHGATYRDGCPYVQYWWGAMPGGGGSAWGARKVASLMGFTTVILCGCPLEAGPYVGNHNLGGMMHRQDVVDQYAAEIESDVEWLDGAYSMSGRTKEILGLPPS